MLGERAPAAPLNAANYDRLQGCGATALRRPLYYSTQLSYAAGQLADGVSLTAAITSSGYVAQRATVLHLSGATGDADIQRMLADRYCQTLQDPQLLDFGVEQRGRDVWMLLAGRAVLPAAADATAAAQMILARVNAARAAGRRCGGKYFAPVAALSVDPALTRAAFEHSHDMATHDYFDHSGRDGSTPATRVTRAGFGNYRIVGENIAAGALTPTQVMEGWLASPEHCENIMDGRFSLIGIAYAENPRTSYAMFWTQDFAAHR